MGNCQAIDAATLVIQHPNGKVEKFYGAVPASEVMKMNPGHYVALLISTTLCPSSSNPKSSSNPNGPDDHKNNIDDHIHKNSDTTNEKKTGSTTTAGSVRITRIKLLRPTDTLVLGQVYRLITTQEVMKGLWAKKQAKGKRSNQFEPLTAERLQRETSRRSEGELDKDNNQVMTKTKRHHHRPRTSSSSGSSSSSSSSSSSQSAATARPRTWQPSLQSISEATS